MTNIEKLPGKTHYTGYANGVWAINKVGGYWQAIRRHDGKVIFKGTLRAVSISLAKLEGEY